MSDDAGLVTVYIDGREVRLPAGKSLLEALLARDVNLPYFCWHPKMGSIGACRQCAVLQYRNEEDTKGRIVMACMTQVADGGRFSIAEKKASDFRQSVVETLMINHPHDCPVCEEGGECHLQDMTVMVGHRDRRYRGSKVTFRNQYLGPLINHEMNRCITCYRCVRFYRDYAGGEDLGAFASRDRVYFGRFEDGVLENEFAGNLVEVCPTGVFTDKPLSKHYTRKWDLESSPSVCPGCALGCNIMVSARYGEFRRIHNRYNGQINGYFLCDRGRFGGNFVNSEARFKRAGVRNAEGKYEAVGAQAAIEHACGLIARSARVIGIGSPRASLEANHTLARLVGENNYWCGMNESGAETHALMLDILARTPARRPTMAETEDFDAVLVLGEDVTNHAPRLALSLRQSVRNRAKEMAASVSVRPWDDAAVRKLAQQERSPLMLVTPMADRLDDVATLRLREAPNDIARLGFDIADRLDDPSSATDGRRGDVQDIVSCLRQANKPLVVSGTGLRHPGILKAAANIAAALANKNDAAGLMLCADECDSLGLAMMGPPRPLESIFEGAAIDTAIVLENDLTVRLSAVEWQALRDKVKHFIVIDCVDNETASVSEVALPSATFAEAEGTLVNNEGTAQRIFAALPPADEVLPAWRWLTHIGQGLQRPEFDAFAGVDDVTRDCAAARPALAGIVDAAPPGSWREHGLKVARMTPRASGRTAMYADKSVRDPKPVEDADSALAFSMEGASFGEPSTLRPFVWSPGWNSNQAVNKFQSEVGGPLADGDPGVRLIGEATSAFEPYAAVAESRGLQIVRRHHIFGSDELSILSGAIAELAPRPYCAVGRVLADALGVVGGDGVEYELDGVVRQLEVVVDDTLAGGCVAVPVGLDGTKHLCNTREVALVKARNWRRRESAPQDIIVSDGKER